MPTFSSIIEWLKKELKIVEDGSSAAVHILQEELPKILVSAIQVLLAGLEADTPYKIVLKTAGNLILSQGIHASEDAIQAAVNKAENNLIEAGTPAPITQAAQAAAATATPLPSDNPAVVAAQAVITAAGTEAPGTASS